MSTERFSRGGAPAANSLSKRPTARVGPVDPRVMTPSKLTSQIRRGLGLGREAKYLPWIRVRRRLTSKVANLFVVPSVLYETRGLHLLSGLEHNAALLAQWLGATELREQFPMWPEPHEHPLSGTHAERDEMLDPMPGLLDIAREVGIKHGNYPKTKIPFVATSDIVLRLGQPPNDRLVFWACKPLGVMLDPERRRTLERLELEQRYALAAGARSFVIDDSLFARSDLAVNLQWLTPLNSELRVPDVHTRLQNFAGHLEELIRFCPLRDAIDSAGRKSGLDGHATDAYFRLAAWSGQVDIDISKPILMTRLAPLGGHGLRRRLSRQLLGDVA